MLFLCQSTHDAILTERYCRSRQIACAAIPVPREYSKQCGVALKVTQGDQAQIQEYCTKKTFKSSGAMTRKAAEVFKHALAQL